MATSKGVMQLFWELASTRDKDRIKAGKKMIESLEKLQVREYCVAAYDNECRNLVER